MKPETAASAVRSLGLGRPDGALPASMRHSAGLVRPSLPADQLGMAKRVKSLPQERVTVLFDVVFADGSRASNQRVPVEILGGLDGDQPARDLIEQQEAEIAQKACRPPRVIQSLTRAAKPEPRLVQE
jgi:hypothetical protein